MTQTRLTSEARVMWEKLEDFQLNDPNAVFNFSARLAKENNWTHTYTERVLQEYKRFLLLAMHAGHPVTPSEAIDQAWHLHLVYTRSYWEKLCRDILGRPLHHEPTAGGADEGAKFRTQYQSTLDSYHRLFGEAPPADIWPTGSSSQAKASRWVDASRHWLVPKPAWTKRLRPRLAVTAMASVLVMVALVSCQPVLEVLDLRGMEFLQFYLTSFFIAFLASFILVKLARGPVKNRAQPLTDPYQIAFLGGGGARVVDAALSVLFGLKLIKIDMTTGRPRIQREAGLKPPDGIHEVEWKVLHAIPAATSVGIMELRQSLTSTLELVKEEAVEAGLILSKRQLRGLRWQAALPMLVVMLIGLGKFFVGISRDKPVAFLVILLFFSLALLILRLAKLKKRSATGESVWKSLYKTRSSIKRRDEATGGLLSDPMQAAMLVALGGYSAMHIPAYAELHSVLKRPGGEAGNVACGTSYGDGGSSDSGGSGDSGGGGSGCGGCGGGGGD